MSQRIYTVAPMCLILFFYLFSLYYQNTREEVIVITRVSDLSSLLDVHVHSSIVTMHTNI